MTYEEMPWQGEERRRFFYSEVVPERRGCTGLKKEPDLLRLGVDDERRSFNYDLYIPERRNNP